MPPGEFTHGFLLLSSHTIYKLLKMTKSISDCYRCIKTAIISFFYSPYSNFVWGRLSTDGDRININRVEMGEK
jgi:hypothetical protein